MTIIYALKSVIRRKKIAAPSEPLNTSALLTILNEVLGPVPRPNHPSKLGRRARATGMLDTVRHWQEMQQDATATQQEVHALITRAELRIISEHTGLSGPHLLKVVRELLPHCVRIRAHNNPFFLLNKE